MYTWIWILLFLGSSVVAAVFIALYFWPTSDVSSKIKQLFSQPNQTPVTRALSHYFDHVFYINLDARTDRRYWMEMELNKLGWNKDQITRVPGIIDKSGPLGCSKAWLETLKLAQQQPSIKHPLFLEDDVEFLLSKESFLEWTSKMKLLHFNWDVMMLSANIQHSQPTELDFVIKIMEAQTTACFSVHPFYLPKLIQHVQKGIDLLEADIHNNQYFIDMHWKSLQPNANWFAFDPLVAKQKSDFSDIEHKVVDYPVSPPLLQSSALDYIAIILTSIGNFKFCDTKFLDQHSNIRVFFGIGNPLLHEDWFYDMKSHMVVLKCEDDVWNQCYKWNLMHQFVTNYISVNPVSCKHVKGILFLNDTNVDAMSLLKQCNQLEYAATEVTYAFPELPLNGFPALYQYPLQMKPTLYGKGCIYVDCASFLSMCLSFPPFPKTNEDLLHHVNSSKRLGIALFPEYELACRMKQDCAQLLI